MKKTGGRKSRRTVSLGSWGIFLSLSFSSYIFVWLPRLLMKKQTNPRAFRRLQFLMDHSESMPQVNQSCVIQIILARIRIKILLFCSVQQMLWCQNLIKITWHSIFLSNSCFAKFLLPVMYPRCNRNKEVSKIVKNIKNVLTSIKDAVSLDFLSFTISWIESTYRLLINSLYCLCGIVEGGGGLARAQGHHQPAPRGVRSH